MRSRWSHATVVLSVLAIVSTALSPAATGSPARPTRGGRLQVLVASDITPRTLVNSISPVNVWVLGSVYETLTRYRLDRLEARPVLAESWRFSPDFTRITFRLRTDVKFHTGRPFTAADVRWNIERVADPRSASQLLNLARWVTRIDTPDPHTVVVTFDRPRPSALDMFENLFIADRETYQSSIEGRAFVGTGPFRFKEWTPGERYVLVRNADYRRPDRPHLDEVTVRIVPDRQTQLIMLQTRSADVAVNLDARTLRALTENPNYQVIVPPVWGTMWGVGLDVTAAPFTDRRARHAVAYLLDRKRIVDTHLLFEEPIQLPWPKSSPAYFADQAARYSYDLNRARALWAEAGVPAGVTIPITVCACYPETFAIVEVLQAELARLGARATIERLESPQYVQRLAGARFNGIWSGIFGWINKTPSTLFVQSFAYRVPNAQNYDTPEYRQVLDAVLSATGSAEQRRVYRRLNELLLEEAFVLPVASAGRPMGALARVEGVTLTRDTIPVVEEFWKSAR